METNETFAVARLQFNSPGLWRSTKMADISWFRSINISLTKDLFAPPSLFSFKCCRITEPLISRSQVRLLIGSTRIPIFLESVSELVIGRSRVRFLARLADGFYKKWRHGNRNVVGFFLRETLNDNWMWMFFVILAWTPLRNTPGRWKKDFQYCGYFWNDLHFSWNPYRHQLSTTFHPAGNILISLGISSET